MNKYLTIIINSGNRKALRVGKLTYYLTMKTRTIFLLTFSIIIFSSCNKNDDNESTTDSSNQLMTVDGNLKGVVSNYTSGTYDAICGYDSGFLLNDGLSPNSGINDLGSPLGSCTITNKGNFELKLSTTTLTSVNSVVTSGITVSDKNAKLGGVGFGSLPMSIFMATKSNSIVGGLYKSDTMISSSGSGSTATFSLFLYSDRDFTINGTTKGSEMLYNLSLNYNLTLKKGWNEVAMKMTTTSIDYSNTLPSNMKWFYISLNALD